MKYPFLDNYLTNMLANNAWFNLEPAIVRCERITKNYYDKQVYFFIKELSLTLKGRGNNTFTSYHFILFNSVLIRCLSEKSAWIGLELGKQCRSIREPSVKDLSNNIKILTNRADKLTIDNSFIVDKILGKDNASIAKSCLDLCIKSGNIIINRVRQYASQLLTKGTSIPDFIGLVSAFLALEWWRFYRIIKTEMYYAYNSAQAVGMRELRSKYPFIKMRWNEKKHNNKRLPNKIFSDSVFLHAQVASPGEVFRLPDSKFIPERMKGLYFPFPPSRPNDNAILTPWLPGLGMPAWEVFHGRLTRVLDNGSI